MIALVCVLVSVRVIVIDRVIALGLVRGIVCVLARARARVIAAVRVRVMVRALVFVLVLEPEIDSCLCSYSCG